MCCKNWKNETLIGITKMDFNKAPFCNFWANLVSFCSCNYLKDALCLQNFHTQFINGCELKFWKCILSALIAGGCGWIRDEKDAALVVTVIIPLASSNLAAANIVKTLSIRFQNNDVTLEYIQ